MADFVAVLKKTIDAQAENTPELRQRVYAKARATIEQKLVMANASQAMAVRQRDLLEKAISETEAFYTTVSEPLHEELSDPLEEFLHETARSSVVDQPEKSASAPAPDVDEPDHGEGSGPNADNGAVNDAPIGPQPTSDERVEDRDRRHRYYEEPRDLREGRSYKGLITGLVAVLLLAGIGYGIWSAKDEITDFASSIGRSDAPDDETQLSQDDQATPESAIEESPQAPAEEPKLTQRLLPDGSEVDAGPAGGETTIGEGTSTSASTSGTAPSAGQNQPAASEAVAVGQQALLYEERGGTQSGSVERGNVVWSVVEESPNEGEPAEPAIRGNLTMPDSKVEMKLTIRRNTDQSIPASHLIEIVFNVPEDFSGGVIDNVQRITFKDTEQAPGNPLIAVPSKIADNFFIIWLNDARTAQDTNLSLMRRLQWIDIPISYRNGRRALISLEKGIPGEKVFNEVLGAN